ncbi:hypothetical protein KAR91_04725 [Candidatus Pacearchaeota archaeon]|nr:hypothetical protein [Candidatus Pacearchaeota archaeon]
MEMNPGEGLKKMTNKEAERWREMAVENARLLKRAVEVGEYIRTMHEALEKRHRELRSAIEAVLVKAAQGEVVWFDDIKELLREAQ